MVRLFISHASKDALLAERLVDLIRAALNLPAAAIRCSSVDGYRLPGGADTNDQIRQEVHEAEAFIGLVSTASVQSMYVLFELGARWGAKRHLIPLLAPDTGASGLGGPLTGLNALRCDHPAQLHQLVEELSVALSQPLESAASFNKYIVRLMGSPASTSGGSAAASAAEMSSKELSEGQLRVLDLLRKAGNNGLNLLEISDQLNVEAQKSQYYLDGLFSDDYIDAYSVVGEPTIYFLTAKARSVLVERGLL